MPEVIRLPLKDNFRETLEAAGFIGREAELSRLESVLGARRSATVLVSGHRGVGKTSLVEEALRRTSADKESAGRLVVRLTLPHVWARNSQETSESVRSQVLRALARGLYFELSRGTGVPEPLKAKAKSLYDKTYLASAKTERVIEHLSEATAANSVSEVRTTKVSVDSRVLRVSLVAILGALGVSGVGVLAWAASVLPPLYQLAIALILVVVAVAILTNAKGMFEWVNKDEDTLANRVMATDWASETGVLDFTPETLEFKLRELLEELATTGKRCVFVIDELDKIDAADEGVLLEEHVIYQIVASLKNFFTLGHAVYVFIAGEDFFRRYRDSLVSGDYSPAHTLFTDVMFVHILGWRDMEGLVDGLITSQVDNTGLVYHKFRNYLCAVSRNHVFDLLTMLGDLASYDGGHPLLVATTPGVEQGHWDTGNIPPDWETVAGGQKIIGAAYEESKRPLRREERFNQALWLSLGQTMDSLLGGQTLQVFVDQDYSLGDWPWLVGMSDADRLDLAGAMEGLLAKAERWSIAEQTEQMITDGEVEKAAILYRLADNPQYPPQRVSDERQNTPFEEAFLQLAKQTAEIADGLRRASLNLDSEFGAELQAADRVSREVGQTRPRRTIPKSAVKLAYQQADELAARLVEWGLERAVSQWATTGKYISASNLDEPNTRTGLPWRQGLAEEFGPFLKALDGTDVAFTIIGGNATENEIVVLRNMAGADVSSIAKAYGSCLQGDKGRERRRQRLPIVAVQMTVDSEPPKMPTEVVDVVREQAGRSFMHWFQVAPRFRTEQHVEDLMGWTPFALSADASNLAELASLLDERSFVSVVEPEGDEPQLSA